MARAFNSDRHWDFPVSPAVLWDTIAAVERFPTWWPWLRRFDPDDGLVTGARWACEVAPPLPWVVRFTIALDHVEAPRRAVARVSGDIRGTAELTLEGAGCTDGVDGGGTRARLASRLAPSNPLLSTAGRVARPLVEWGHDWVLDQGLAQFVHHAAMGDDGP